jgi:hypothetical protein
MPVLEWACVFLSKFASRHQRIQLQDLERLAESDLKLLKAVLKGVRVTVSVPAGRRPARPIKDLVPNVGNYHFMKGDEETTIKVCSVIWLSALLTAWLLGILRRKIRLQASLSKIIRDMRQRTTKSNRPRRNLHHRRRADVQESTHAGDDVGGPATSHQKSA